MTVAGDGVAGYAGDNGPAISAELITGQITADSAGDLFFSDSSNRIREVTASTGTITTVAGNGTAGYSGDGGNAISAKLNGPIGVAVDSSGNLYISDSVNYVVRKVTFSGSVGTITTVAGDGSAGYSGDGGPALSAAIDPSELAVDSSGNLYFSDQVHFVIRKVTFSNGVGTITTVAGDGTWGYNGDNQSATNAELGLSTGLAVDTSGNLYIADMGNSRIRKVTFSNGVGTITTVAGNGTTNPANPEASNGLLAINAEIYPMSVAVDASRNLYIADNSNLVWKVTASTGIINTLAGEGTPGYSGDEGPALGALLYGPSGMALDGAGNLYIADVENYRIREVGAGEATPAITWLAPGPITYGTPLSTTQLNAASTVAGTFTYTPAAGTVLTVGTQALSVTFTPTNTADFNTATATVPLVVNKATPPITWATPASIASGTALSTGLTGQLNASSTVAGTFTYSSAAGTVLPAGSNTLSVTFTPTDTTDYAVATQGVILLVQKPAETAWDTGTVTLKVNGTSVASYAYGEADTPSSVAEALASAASGSTLIKVNQARCNL